MLNNNMINLGGNFWNLGWNFLDFWQFFSNFLAFQWATFQHFTSTIGKGLLATESYANGAWNQETSQQPNKQTNIVYSTLCSKDRIVKW